MTHISLDTPKIYRFLAIRLPNFAFGKIFAAFAGACEATRAANASAYGVAMGFGTTPNSTAKREDDY